MILVYSEFDAASVRTALGAPQYSYHFVLDGYAPILGRIGEVVPVKSPEDEVDALYDACLAEGRACVFLCFTPPHLVPVTLRCPTIPVFAWEFSSLPCETWSDDPRSDWRVVLRHCGRAITLSTHTADLVREAMGMDFPVFAIPTPSYDAMAPLFDQRAERDGFEAERVFAFRGAVFDSHVDPLFRGPLPWPMKPPPPVAAEEAPLAVDSQAQAPMPVPEVVAPPLPMPARRGARERVSLSLGYAEAWYRDVLYDMLPDGLRVILARLARVGRRVYRALLPRPAMQETAPPEMLEIMLEPEPDPTPEPEPEQVVRLSGVVYTAVLSPADGRKNWLDLVTAFLWAFREEPRATLVLKMPRSAQASMHSHIYHALSRFTPFACRVVLAYGFLEDAEYAALVRATTYYVNVSHGEGLCLPLMAFLSAGVPAIAPDHTAMADYVRRDAAFILRSGLEHNVWPFDPRDLFTTMRYRLDWSSIEEAFRASFRVALSGDGAYDAMGRAAHAAMRRYCAGERVRDLLADALDVRGEMARNGAEAVPAFDPDCEIAA